MKSSSPRNSSATSMGVGNALGLSLIDELDFRIPLDKPYGIHDLVPVGPCDYADLPCSGLDYIFDGIEEDGLVGDRDELLLLLGEVPKPCAVAAGKDERLHL